jgi:CHAT domain-containing protein
VARPFAASRRTRFEGEEAGLDRLLEHLQGVDGSLRALHVAAHAFVDPDRPERNGIVLSGGEMLRVDRVRHLRIHSDLVVLSCCDSARGTPTAGEGQRGLVRAFLVAGAQRVVASCWRVSDAQTPEFMGRLYEAWQGEGMSLPGALRAAQLERLQAGGKLAHPYYWAAFVAWGLP